MTVSIEWFVVQNLGMNALILSLAARMAAVRTGKGRILCGAALGCGYAVCAYLPWGRALLGLVPRTAVCAAMTLVLCGRRASERRRTLRAFAFIWVSTLLLGGTGAGVMYFLGSAGYGAWAAVLTAGLGSGAMLLLTAERTKRIGSFTAQLTIICGGRGVRMEAAVDTGNLLTEPLSDLPVIVVERGALRGLEAGRGMRRVPFSSVGGGGVLQAFLPDRVRINGRECDAYIAVCDGQLSMEGCGLIPGRCMEDEMDHGGMGQGTAVAVGRRGSALHRRQSDAAGALHAAGGGKGDGSAASRRRERAAGTDRAQPAAGSLHREEI